MIYRLISTLVLLQLGASVSAFGSISPLVYPINYWFTQFGTTELQVTKSEFSSFLSGLGTSVITVCLYILLLAPIALIYMYALEQNNGVVRSSLIDGVLNLRGNLRQRINRLKPSRKRFGRSADFENESWMTAVPQLLLQAYQQYSD